MEIFTLVKAEIRNRKGIFFGFMLLTALIVVSTMTMLGVNKNYDDAMDRAFKVEDKGELFTYFRYGVYTNEMRARLKGSELVDKVEEYPEILELVRTRVVDCTIGGNLAGQGRTSLRLIMDYLVYGTVPERDIVYMDARILVKESL